MTEVALEASELPALAVGTLREEVRVAVASFEEFFEQTTPGLVGQAYVLTGNLQEAQDIVQEAMLRAWREWPKISAYEDPAGWARKVAHNLAVSRWRRLAVRSRHERAERPAQVLGPDVDHLDLVAVVSRLPAGQRRALVLFDIVGLSGEEVAAELNVPSGTVRGWLTRARRTVAAELGWDEPIIVGEPISEEGARHG